jgi:hypothetical protein
VAGQGGAAGAAGVAGAQAGQQQAAGGDPWFVGLYDNTGKLNHAKFDALPAHLKGSEALFKRYPTVEALLGGLQNASNLAGKKALAPLPPGSPPEAVAERSKLMAQLNNTPEKPEGYGFKRPDNIPEGQWNQSYVDGVAGILHKHHASPELAAELLKHDAEHAGKIGEGVAKAQAEAMAREQTALKEAFGADYAKKIDLAVRGAKTMGMDPTDPIFQNHKAVVMMAKFAELVGEDKIISGETSANAGMDDRAKALDIMNNKANPLYAAFHNPEHPQHTQAVEQKSRFTQAWLAKQKKTA